MRRSPRRSVRRCRRDMGNVTRTTRRGRRDHASKRVVARYLASWDAEEVIGARGRGACRIDSALSAWANMFARIEGDCFISGTRRLRIDLTLSFAIGLRRGIVAFSADTDTSRQLKERDPELRIRGCQKTVQTRILRDIYVGSVANRLRFTGEALDRRQYIHGQKLVRSREVAIDVLLTISGNKSYLPVKDLSDELTAKLLVMS